MKASACRCPILTPDGCAAEFRLPSFSSRILTPGLVHTVADNHHWDAMPMRGLTVNHPGSIGRLKNAVRSQLQTNAKLNPGPWGWSLL
jgi:hypothetical protein